MTTYRCLRTVVGQHLAKWGGRNRDIVALEADLKDSTQSVNFQNAHPERYVQCGIAEQNMVGMAAGFALAGKIPVVHSFACFISMRSCEQVRTTVAYPRLNVKFIATHAGLSAGTAGPTHHATEDVAIMRAIPNMTVLAPGDASEACQVLDEALSHKGPVYIRLPAGNAHNVYEKKTCFKIGKATVLRKGDDAAIITTGNLMYEAVQAHEILLEKFGIKARVLQMASIKPIDRKAVMNAAKQTRAIVVAEEHNVLGGLGGAVCEIASEIDGVVVKRLGINDSFSNISGHPALLKGCGLTAQNIASNVRNLLMERARHGKA